MTARTSALLIRSLGLVAILGWCTGVHGQGELFLTPELPTPYTVHDLRVADLNGDGADDLIGLGESGFLMTFLANHGEFMPGQTLEVAGFAFSFALDDLDLDGDLDVVIGDASADRILTLLNDGAGTFLPGAEVKVPHRPDLVATAFLDDDSLPDIAVVARFEIVAYTLLADGHGGYALHEFFTHDERADAIHAVDIDDDGDDDILVGNDDSDDIRLYRNNNASLTLDGLRVTGNVRSIDTGDLDGDGDLDVVVGVTTGSTVHIFLNEGGDLGPQTLAQIVSRPFHVRLVDFDFDGDIDIGVQSDSILSTVGAVTHNQGNGLFDDVVTGLVADAPESMDIGDLDGDGDLDLAVATEHSISLLLNQADLSFAQPATYPAGDTLVDVQASDVDLDGLIDLVISGGGTPRLIVMRGDAEAGFLAPMVTDLDVAPRRIRLADLDADGDADAFFVNSGETEAHLHVNEGGSFDSRMLVPIGPLPADIGTGDIDADGDIDLVATNSGMSTISVVLNEDGVYADPVTFPAGSTPRSLELVDVDADADLDVLVGNVATTTLSVLVNDGTGAFTPLGASSLPAPPRDIIVGDLDADGDPDVVVTSLFDDMMSILINTGDGSFESVAELQLGEIVRPVLTDVNNDGLLDILYALHEENVAHVLLANGRGGFAEDVYRAGLTLTAIAAADVDLDGDRDLISTTGSGHISIVDNQLITPCAADMNGDGMLNILDFVAFQLLWQAHDAAADCDADGAHSIVDFICFQHRFQEGCP